MSSELLEDFPTELTGALSLIKDSLFFFLSKYS
jgi:hypothetical protein